MSFANIGRPSNSLGVNFQKNDIYPQIGAKALHQNYREKEEIEYYHVPTPLTELMFKTTRSKGQLLDGFLTTVLLVRNLMVLYLLETFGCFMC